MEPPIRSNSIAAALVGRSLAACAHPVAAWRSKSRAFRLQVFFGYFVAGYVLMLTILLFL